MQIVKKYTIENVEQVVGNQREVGYLKYGTSQIKNGTADGRQMSDEWIRSRLRTYDGLPNDVIAEILSDYTPVLGKVSVNGTTTYKQLDSFGYVDTTKKTFSDIFGGG